MSAASRQIVEYWGRLRPYTHIPLNESEYEKLLAFVDELMWCHVTQKMSG